MVCSLDELIKEIIEDLEDNGKLDCLREILNPDEDNEKNEDRIKRKAAQWDSDCSFEAMNDLWIPLFKKNYGVEEFVDVNGGKHPADFEDQADMCEIVRSLKESGKIEGMGEGAAVTIDIIDHISCPGEEGQTQICAATQGSFADQKKWFIALEGPAIKFGDKPEFKLAE